MQAISRIIDDNPAIVDLAHNCLVDSEKKDTGRKGLTVDSVVRAALLKQMMGLSYQELSFYLQDSVSYNNFAQIDAQEGLSPTSLQYCIKHIDANTLEDINRLLLLDSKDKGVEKGRMVRIDSTVTETNIRAPCDSQLIWDCVRVSVRLLKEFETCITPGEFHFCNRSRAVKRKAYQIGFKKGRNTLKLDRELLKLLVETRQYLCNALSCADVVTEPLRYTLIVEQVRDSMSLS